MFKSAAPPTNLQELTASIQQAVRVSGGYKKFQRMYANDRVAFAYDCFGKVGKSLTFYQEEILAFFDDGYSRVAVRGPHGLGKTYIAALLVHHACLTAEDDAKIITTASAWRQVEKYLWPEIKKLSKAIQWDIIGREPYDPNHEILQMSIRLNQGTVEAFAVVSDDYQTIEGAHAKNLTYIFDEAKSIPRDTWNAAEGAFANANIGKLGSKLVPISREDTGLINESISLFQTEQRPIADVWDMIMAGKDPDVGTDIELEQGYGFDDNQVKNKLPEQDKYIGGRDNNKLAVYQPGIKSNKDVDVNNNMGIAGHSDGRRDSNSEEHYSPEESDINHKHDDNNITIAGHSDGRRREIDEEHYGSLEQEKLRRHDRALASSERAAISDHNTDVDHNGDVLPIADHNALMGTITDHNAIVPSYGDDVDHNALMGARAPMGEGTIDHKQDVPYSDDHNSDVPHVLTITDHNTDVHARGDHNSTIVHRGDKIDHNIPITDRAYAFAISTPGNPNGQFYDIHSHAPGYEDWITKHVTLDDAIRAGRISREWADQRARQWGIDSAIFKNRVLGEFADNSEEGIIPLSWVRASNERWKVWRDHGYSGDSRADGYRAIGIDVARSGDDKTVFAVRQRFAIRQIYAYSKLSTTSTADKVIANHDGRYLHIEMDGGLGAAVYDILKQKGISPRLLKPITVSAPTSWRDHSKQMRFFNVRAAMWWNIREMLDPTYGNGLLLPPVEELILDLTTPQYESKADGVIVLENKDSIRSRLGRSTDFADAVCLAFWSMSSGGGIVV
jgi:hypothetical protein